MHCVVVQRRSLFYAPRNATRTAKATPMMHRFVVSETNRFVRGRGRGGATPPRVQPIDTSSLFGF